MGFARTGDKHKKLDDCGNAASGTNQKNAGAMTALVLMPAQMSRHRMFVFRDEDTAVFFGPAEDGRIVGAQGQLIRFTASNGIEGELTALIVALDRS